jgi:hypothetical protein
MGLLLKNERNPDERIGLSSLAEGLCQRIAEALPT